MSRGEHEEEEDSSEDEDAMYDLEGDVPASAKPGTKSMDRSILAKIRVDEFHSDEVKCRQHRVANDMRDAASSQSKAKDVDRSERATTEQVMDPRTRLILYKLVNSGLLKEINGCVSTGKEANVYYAIGEDGTPAAVKVFKTSILVFRDREKYVSGEYRFQRFCKHNPRKMVRTWAEKEARNLQRLFNGGVPVPRMRLLRQHVLVMDFIGQDGWPAPRLKDMKFASDVALEQCYFDLCWNIRRMYVVCRLVHGDLSEYNILVHEGKAVIIDVSQSVEHDHPESMNFLRRDIANINSFFRARGLACTIPLQELFEAATNMEERSEFVDFASWTAANKARWASVAENRGSGAEVDDAVFLNVPVPRKLADVAEFRKVNPDVESFVSKLINQQSTKEPPATQPTSPPDVVHSDKKVEFTGPSTSLQQVEHETMEESSESSDSEESEEGADAPKSSGGPQLADMTKEERRAHQQAVKAANRERRANKKMPKHAKKKACQSHKRK